MISITSVVFSAQTACVTSAEGAAAAGSDDMYGSKECIV